MYHSFKSYIPFQIHSPIKKYLDDYNKKVISRNIDYYTKIYPKRRLLLANRENIEHINFDDKLLLLTLPPCYDGPPHVPNINIGVFLFGLTSLFMFLLSKKF